MTISPLGLCQWLESTPWSPALRESIWMYPLVESVHLLALCLFLGFAVLLDLRLLGIIFRRTPVSKVAGQLLPWTSVGFVLMVISGALLFYTDPVHFYFAFLFRLKAALLVAAGLNAWIFHSTVYRKVADWDLSPVTPTGARVAGAVSLFLWTSVVTVGRLVAYRF